MPSISNKSTATVGKLGKPRSCISAFAFFMRACRAEIDRRHPRAIVSFTVLSRACSERWRSTSAKERALFVHLAEMDKQRFELEKRQSLATKTLPTKPRIRYRKDPAAPKKAATPFFLFASSYRSQLREQQPNLSFSEISKKLGEKWWQLSLEERRPFFFQAALLKEKYDAAKAAYKSLGSPSTEPSKKGEKMAKGEETLEMEALQSIVAEKNGEQNQHDVEVAPLHRMAPLLAEPDDRVEDCEKESDEGYEEDGGGCLPWEEQEGVCGSQDLRVQKKNIMEETAEDVDGLEVQQLEIALGQ